MFQLNDKLNILEEKLKISILKNEENSKLFSLREQDLLINLNSKEENIKSFIQKIEIQEEEFQEICSKFYVMNKDFESFKVAHDRTIAENSLLKSKIKFFEEENQSINKRYGELNSINIKFEEENSSFEKQLNYYRKEFESLKAQNENNINELHKTTEENFSLKVKNEDRSKMLEDLMGKYASLKKASEDKAGKSEGVNK